MASLWYSDFKLNKMKNNNTQFAYIETNKKYVNNIVGVLEQLKYKVYFLSELELVITSPNLGDLFDLLIDLKHNFPKGYINGWSAPIKHASKDIIKLVQQ